MGIRGKRENIGKKKEKDGKMGKREKDGKRETKRENIN